MVSLVARAFEYPEEYKARRYRRIEDAEKDAGWRIPSVNIAKCFEEDGRPYRVGIIKENETFLYKSLLREPNA